MKKFFSLSFIVTLVVYASLPVGVTSCKKETIVHDTVTVIDVDTLVDVDTMLVESVDTVFAMDVARWDAYSYLTLGMVAPSATTYMNTAEGIKLMAQAVRLGLRLQTKKEIGIKDKTIYFKWKANGQGDFAHFVIQLKYDPTTTDGLPFVQNIDFPAFSTKNAVNGSYVIANDTWYYTRIRAIPGTDKYQFVTATGNYDNNGGTAVVNQEVYVYTKHGYLSFRIGDTFTATTWLVIAEAKIASN